MRSLSRCSPRSRSGNEPSRRSRVARETLQRLQDLALNVAAEIDQHANSVAEISAQLATDDQDEASVVAAVTQLIDANRRMKRQLDLHAARRRALDGDGQEATGG